MYSLQKEIIKYLTPSYNKLFIVSDPFHVSQDFVILYSTIQTNQAMNVLLTLLMLIILI